MVERCEVCGVLLRPSSRPRKATCERGVCAQEYRRRIESTPGARACPVCGRLAGADGTCGEAYCLGEIESRQARKRSEEERIAAKEAAAREIERGLRASGMLPAASRVAVLPATDRPLVPQDPTRRTLFAERLAELMDDAAADPDGPTGDPPSAEALVSPAEALARAACASCRGLCCRHGEPHAFLRPATLRRYLRQHPEQTPSQALQAYLRCIPAQSTAGSCIYHGAQGCALPRALRSDVCNRYLCEDLERLGKTAAAPPILAIGFEEERVVRVSLLEADGVRTISEASPGPAPAPPVR